MLSCHRCTIFFLRHLFVFIVENHCSWQQKLIIKLPLLSKGKANNDVKAIVTQRRMPQAIHNYAAKYNYASARTKKNEEKKKRLSTFIPVCPYIMLPFKTAREYYTIRLWPKPGCGFASIRFRVSWLILQAMSIINRHPILCNWAFFQ